jgi:hypothetical protein
LALAVPLSRFTPQVGGGSAFFVRPLHITKNMSIQTTQFIGDDGKIMTPEQVEISRLKKANATLTEKYTELEKRIASLEAKNQDPVIKH